MNKKVGWIAVCVCILGVVFRALYLNIPFWYDEACSWFSASQNFPFGILQNLLNLDLQHTPLYFFLLNLWMKIFGNSEISIRFLSLLFGIASIPIVYIVSSKIMSKFQAQISTMICAVSPILVVFSTEARMYPVIVFLVLVSLNYLIDFEQNGDKKSLIKLAAVNILIPYTLVGGILYNISLGICYGFYLFKSKSQKLLGYLKSLGAEFLCLIPYFVMLIYYAKMRGLFVIRHEGAFEFWQLMEVLRNFFAPSIVENPYWPSLSSLPLNPEAVFLILVPCIYFLYGLITGIKSSDKFLKSLYYVFFTCFGLAVFFSVLEINVFTVRYILYLLPPLFILSIWGLFRSIGVKHLGVFFALFILCAGYFDCTYLSEFKAAKTNAFKAVKIECDKLGLGADDVLILPFGADAPYYFKNRGDVRVLNFDFHKEVRNPYNKKFYDDNQSELLVKSSKWEVLSDAVLNGNYFSNNFVRYFADNVNYSVPSGRYALIGLYDSDVTSLVDGETIAKSIENMKFLAKNDKLFLNTLLQKFLFDIRLMLEADFEPVNFYKEGNYTYLLYRKK